MKFNPSKIKKDDTREIINTLIDHVTKTDEEAVEEAKKKQKSTELKTFIAKSKGLPLGQLDKRLQELYNSENISKYAKDFINQHAFSEERLNSDVSYLEIKTPNYGRTDQFILLEEDGYLRVLTAERRKWTKRTVEKLIKHLPELDRVYLSPSDLEGMVNEELEDTSLSGFTAKYNPYFSDKSLSIRFHGGEQKDLDDVEDIFNARPSRVEFTQRNSPIDALEGAVKQEGYYSIPRVREGSESQGYETISKLSASYETHDAENFEVEQRPRESFEDGFSVDGSTTLRLVEEANEPASAGVTTDGGDSSLVEKLESDILDRKRRYKYSVWDVGDFLVFDTETREPFQIAIEGDDINIHAKPATTSRSLRDFSQIVLEEFNSTYRFEKVSKEISV